MKATGQLAALQQANATLVEKWRAKDKHVELSHYTTYCEHCFAEWYADELEAATKEATQ